MKVCNGSLALHRIVLQSQQLKTIFSAAITARARGPGAGKTVRISVAVPLTAGFNRLLPATKAICHCPNRSKGQSWRQNRRESGECRFKKT
jgi:hypothetical protein